MTVDGSRRTATLPPPPRRSTVGPGRPRVGGVAWGLLVAAALLVVLVGLRVLAPADDSPLPDALRDLVTLGLSVFVESLPFVFLGILVSVAVRFWVPTWVFERVLPRTPVLRRAALSFLGVLLPVCECGNVPLARGLIQKGLRPAEAMTFLLAAPILNPVTIVTTYQAFGWTDGILVWRIVGAFLVANLIGWVFSLHPHQERLLTPGFEASCRTHRHDAETGSRPRRALLAFADESAAMLPALAVGSAIAGAIQIGVSREVLTTLGANPVWSVLALMALAFVISVCSNVDAFFVLSFGSTFLPGGIVAFLLFGAMVDVKMLALLRTTFTAATLARITGLAAASALVIGLAVNLLG